MTYIYVTACFAPLFSSARGLWKKNNNYYISTDLQIRMLTDTDNQYMLMYEALPDTYSNYRETLNSLQQLTLQDLKNGYVIYHNNKWSFRL